MKFAALTTTAQVRSVVVVNVIVDQWHSHLLRRADVKEATVNPEVKSCARG